VGFEMKKEGTPLIKKLSRGKKNPSKKTSNPAGTGRTHRQGKRGQPRAKKLGTESYITILNEKESSLESTNKRK